MPRSFRGYAIGKKIAVGGMSTIYEGIQTALDRRVAIKVLHPALADDQTFLARFEREAKAASSLGHRNIVTVFDFGSEEDTYFIVMEYVDGVDLRTLLRRTPRVPPEIALIILEEICHGLGAAHSRGICHRDIKPGNILLSLDGDVKIGDFGLARHSEGLDEMTVANLTAPGYVLGTPAYMSPEQAVAEGTDSRSDIFSLGVLAYEMFSGEKPFWSDSPSEIREKIIAHPPVPLRKLAKAIPKEIETLVDRMLQKDPGKRPPDVNVILSDLLGCMEVLDPGGSILKHRRSYLVQFLKDPDECASTLLGNRIHYHMDRGHYFMTQGLGRITEAIEEYSTVLALDPQHFKAQAALAELRGRLATSGRDATTSASSSSEETGEATVVRASAGRSEAGSAKQPEPGHEQPLARTPQVPRALGQRRVLAVALALAVLATVVILGVRWWIVRSERNALPGGEHSASPISSDSTGPSISQPTIQSPLLAAPVAEPTSIRIAWSWSGSGFEQTEVAISTDGGFTPSKELVTATIPDSMIREWVFRNLQMDTQYHARVRVFAMGQSRESIRACRTLGIPVPKFSVAATDSQDPARARLTWTWTGAPGAAACDSIEVHSARDRGFAIGPATRSRTIRPSDGGAVELSGLQPATTYYFRLRVHSAGRYRDTGAFEYQSGSPPPPLNPHGLSCQATSDTSLRVGWDWDAPGREGSFDHYEITCVPEGAGLSGIEQPTFRVDEASTTEKSVAGLRPGTAYQVRVTAVLTNGNRFVSEPVTGTTQEEQVSRPLLRGLSDRDGNLVVSWDWDGRGLEASSAGLELQYGTDSLFQLPEAITTIRLQDPVGHKQQEVAGPQPNARIYARLLLRHRSGMFSSGTKSLLVLPPGRIEVPAGGRGRFGDLAAAIKIVNEAPTAPAGGYTVVLGAGIHQLAGFFALGKSITIEGEDAASTTVKLHGGCFHGETASPSTFTFKRITLATDYSMIVQMAKDVLRLEGCRLIAGTQEAIYLVKSGSAVCTDCSFISAANAPECRGVKIPTDALSVRVTLTRCTFAGFNIGISASGRSVVKCEDCQISGSQRSGIEVNNGAEVTFEGGTIEGSLQDGILVLTGTCAVRSAAILNNAEFGMLADGTAGPSVIRYSHCSFSGNGKGNRRSQAGGQIEEE